MRARHRRPWRVLGAGAAMAMVGVIPLLSATGPAAAGTIGSYSVAAQAPVWQFTYDFPQANFHPQADGELTYAESDLDPTRSHALSSVAWPGAAGGNLGSLIAVLGGPTVNALNDPVRAEAFSSGTSQQNTTAPEGTTMAASVVPSGSEAQKATSTTATGGTSLGQGGALGSSTAKTGISLDQAGHLTASAVSSVDNIDIAGIFKAASLMSSANEESAGGAKPTGSSQLAVHDLTIAGQQAYVDGSGVHVGAPGQPPSSAVNDIVNKALAGFGMKIYFTSPQQVTIANNTYNYAASILITWVPPGDSHGDTFTFSFGGAAIAMEAGEGVNALNPVTAIPPVATGASPDSGGGPSLALPPSPATPSLSLPSAPVPVPTTRPAARPVTQLAAPASATAAGSPAVPTAWYLLLILAVIAGAALMTRVPGLLTAGAAARCRDEHPWSTDRST